jgi:hypothetical protein
MRDAAPSLSGPAASSGSARVAVLPLLRRVLADQPVDRLADQIGMAGVTGVLLDQVDDHAAQVGRLGPVGDRERAIEATVGECLVDRGLRVCDGLEPQRT